MQDWNVEDVKESEKFDLIILYEMLYYFNEQEVVDLLLRSVNRWLAPGGHILISIDSSSKSSFYSSVVRKVWPDECCNLPDAEMVERIIQERFDGLATVERWFEYQFEVDVREPYDDAYLKLFTYQVAEQRSMSDCYLGRVREVVREVVDGQTEFKDHGCVLLVTRRM